MYSQGWESYESSYVLPLFSKGLPFHYFLTVFPDGHCVQLAVKYLIYGIDKQMTHYFKAYSKEFHIKKSKLQ